MKDISIQKLGNNDKYEWLMFVFYASPGNTKKAFRENGIEINDEKDLFQLQFADDKYNVLSICKSIRLNEMDIKTNINFVN